MHRHSPDYWLGLAPPGWAPANWAMGTLAPRVNLSEDDARVVATVELPGVDDKAIQLELANNTLTVWGEKTPDDETRKEGNVFHLMERASGSFRRSIPIPVEVDEATVEATFRNGVLTVILPKVSPERSGQRRIPITGD